MFNYKNLPMVKKLLFSLMALLIPAFIILLIISSWMTNNSIEEVMLNETSQMSYRYANFIKGKLEENVTIAKTLAHTFVAQRDRDELTRENVNSVLKKF